MPLPSGIQTTTLTFGPATDFAGNAVAMTVRLTPTHPITWAATGAPLLNFDFVGTAAAGSVGSIVVPVTNQTGFVDQNGNSFSGWAYAVTVTYTRDSGEQVTRNTSWQPVLGQSTVDLDLLPNGNITIPVTAPIATVTSVNGQTGAVTVAGGASQSALDAVSGRVTTLEGSSATQTSVTAVAASVTAVSGRVTTLEGSSATQTSVAAVSTRVSALETAPTPSTIVTTRQWAGRLVSLGTYGSANGFAPRNASTTATFAGWSRCPFEIQVDCTNLQFTFHHWYNNGSNVSPVQVDADPAAPLVGLKAMAIINGVAYPLTVGGQQVFSINPGDFVTTDRLTACGIVTAATRVDVFTYIPGAGNGNIWYSNRSASPDSSGGANGGGGFLASTDATYPSAITSVPDTQLGSTAASMWTATAITGTHLGQQKPTVLLVGDSQGHGQGELSSQNGGIHLGNSNLSGGGFLLRGLRAAGIPALQCCIGGDKANIFKTLAGHYRRSTFLGDVSVVVCEHGRNDLSQGETATTIANNLIYEWSMFSGRGRRVLQPTIILGGVTSTDGFWTVENQTVGATESTRSAVNNWLRDGAPLDKTTMTFSAVGSTGATIVRMGQRGHPLYTIWDVAPAVASTTAGKWKAPTNARTVTDASISASSSVLSSSTANFTSADVGRRITVTGAGASGADLHASIMKINSSTSVTFNLSQTASTAVSGALAKIGDDMTRDGTHPGLGGHILLAALIDATKLI